MNRGTCKTSHRSHKPGAGARSTQVNFSSSVQEMSFARTRWSLNAAAVNGRLFCNRKQIAKLHDCGK